VLIGRTGRDRASWKVRPPLVFSDEHAAQLVAALAAACDALD
jgi:4-aminobutyrate aminotransferase-like enzyme